MNNRNTYIDIAKGLLVFLVVYGHSIQFGFGYEYGESYGCLTDYVFRMIYSFHMPSFMAISGYLFYYSNKRNIKEIILSRLISIGIPYLTYCSIMVLILLPAKYNEAFGLILGTYKSGFWFLPSVMFNCITVSLLTYISRKKRKVIALLLSFVIIYTIIPEYIIDGKYTCMYTCFVTGYLVNMLKSKDLIIKRSAYIIPIAVIALIICSLFYDSSMYVYSKELINNGTFNYQWIYDETRRYIVRIFGSISFMYIIRHDILSKWLKKTMCNLSRYSLGVYCASTIILTVYYKAIGNMNINIPHNYIYPIILAIAITSILYKFFCYCEKSNILKTLFLGGR